MAPRTACLALALLVVSTGSAAALSHGKIVGDTGDPCNCKRWMTTYDEAGMHCGKGLEFYFASGMHPQRGALLSLSRAAFGYKVCNRFYERIRRRYCMNVNIGRDMGTWCYVKNTCDDLRGGQNITGSNFAWKMCDVRDVSFREYTPLALAVYAQRQKLDLSLLAKLTYVTYDEALWDKVSAFFIPGNGTLDDLRPELRADLEEINNLGDPVLFETNREGRPPHRLVYRGTVFGISEERDKASYRYPQLDCLHKCDFDFYDPNHPLAVV